MSYDAELHDGFDTLGPVGFVLVDGDTIADDGLLFAGEWTSIWKSPTASGPLDATVAAPLGEMGRALRLSVGNSTSGAVGISRTLPGSYGRILGGMMVSVPAFSPGYRVGVAFGDGDTDQVAVVINASGQIEALRASGTGSALSGTVLGTSTDNISAGEAVALAWDIEPHNSAGKVKVWINNQVVLNLSGVDTQNSANATVNALRVMMSTSTGGFLTNAIVVDDFYGWLFTSSGGAETPAHNPIVETQFPISDDAIDFAFGAAILGLDDSATTSKNAPGANQLWLRRYTPEASGTLDAVSLIAGATSASAKFKAVAYADSAGAPNALLSSGVEVVGCVDGDRLDGSLVTPQAITKGTPVWIGFIGDTSVSLLETDTDTTAGYKAANTYGSGAPGTAPAMTPNQPSWVIYGTVSGVTADFWSVLNNNPMSGDRSFLVSSSATDQDTFGFPILSTTPTTIYSLAVKSVLRRADAGARTMDLITISAATTDSGDTAGQTPATNYATLASYWKVDPDTTAAWNASGVNLATHGYKIAS